MKSARLLLCLALMPIACDQGPPAALPPPPTASVATVADAPSTPSPMPAENPSKITASPSISPNVGASSSSNPPGASATTKTVAPRPRVRLDVPVGTLLAVEVQTALSSASSKTGDDVLAVLTGDVALEGFKLDQGAEVRGQVRAAVAGMGVKGRARLVLAFDAVMENGEKLSIETEAIDTRAVGAAALLKDDEIEIPRGARLTLAVIK